MDRRRNSETVIKIISYKKPLMKTKVCPGCRKRKILSLFYFNKRTGKYSYKCKMCRVKANGEWRNKNRLRYRELAKKYTRELKQEIIKAYGGKCACCGEATFEFLTIDHINGHGREHVRTHGTGRTIYYWLKHRGFPKKDFQLLCCNCNFAKGHYGCCPHKRQKRKDNKNA